MHTVTWQLWARLVVCSGKSWWVHTVISQAIARLVACSGKSWWVHTVTLQLSARLVIWGAVNRAVSLNVDYNPHLFSGM